MWTRRLTKWVWKTATSPNIASIHVLPISETLDLFAKEKARLRLAGTPADDNFDLLIGCTAIVYDMVMVTENIHDFKNFSGIRLENWIKR